MSISKSRWLFARPPEARAIVVARGDAAEVVYATGIVEPVHWAKIVALQRKRVVELCRCEGEPVKKGEILARLDDAAADRAAARGDDGRRGTHGVR